MSNTQWVSVSSHRARQRLDQLVGGLGQSYGRWPSKGWPSGEYYELPAHHVIDIKGVRVLRKPPNDLFKHISFQ